MSKPKRKWSKARTASSKANWKLTAPNLSACPRCHELKMPHRVCKGCGHYDGKEIVAVEQ